METGVQKCIEEMLTQADYEYDASVRMWAGSVRGVRDVYVQGASIEEVRQELS